MSRPSASPHPLTKTMAAILLLTLAACTPNTGLAVHADEIKGSEALSHIIEAGLQGTRWILQSYGPSNQPVTVLGEPAVTAEFTGDRKLRGMAGCNTYATSFAIEGDVITLGDLRQTPFGCPDRPTWNQETSYLEALNTAESISIEGDELAITYGGGKLLFRRESSLPAVSLTGRQWRLVAFETENGTSSPVPGTMIIAKFVDDRIMGIAGCNSYSGAYAQKGKHITIVETVVTLESCLGKGVMAQEAMYLAALRSAETAVTDENVLMLTHGDGTLIFTAADIASETPETDLEKRTLR